MRPETEKKAARSASCAAFVLPPAVLAELRGSIADRAGVGAADEILFRLGRDWGESVERGAGGDDPRVRLEAALARVPELELGEVWLDEFELSAAERDCRIVVRVLDPLQAGDVRAPAPASEAPEAPEAPEVPEAPEAAEAAEAAGASAPCGLTVGFVTGLVAAVTGLDVVSVPLPDTGDRARAGGGFEIRPAHTWTGAPPQTQPLAGTARFFLHSLGPRLSGSVLSLADLVEYTGDAVILIDADDIVRYWNKGAEEMFHFRREEVVGRKVGFIVPDDLLASDELGWIQRKIEQEGVLSNFITRRIPKDGPELTVSLTRTVLHDDRGRVVGSTAIIRDVTAHVQAEQELARTSHLAALGELAATVAHEIKNPLTGIYTAIQILSRALDPGDPRKSVFDDIQAEIRRLDSTVQDLLGFARPSIPKPMPTDLATFLRESFEAPGVQAELASHRLELELPEECIVPIEASLIMPAVNNIVVNAAQAMDSVGTVHVSATVADGFVTIAVSDTGPGIPADQLERIFEPFSTTKARGTGLGLSIARKNVEAHGGQVVAENLPGGGARFLISLPLATGT